MPNSRFALHGKRPSLIHGLCAFFASNSRFMRLFQAPLDTPLDSPFSATLSVHGLHFTLRNAFCDFRTFTIRSLNLVSFAKRLFRQELRDVPSNSGPLKPFSGPGGWSLLSPRTHADKQPPPPPKATCRKMGLPADKQNALY